jgi:hypothetical protein
MGIKVSKSDLSILDSVERWIKFASHEVHEIGGWRDHAAMYVALHAGAKREQERRRSQFFTDTSQIVSHIGSRHPSLSSSHITTVYEILSRWFDERSASALPAQSHLIALMDNAVFNVRAVYGAILQNVPRTWSAMRDLPGADHDGGQSPARRGRKSKTDPKVRDAILTEHAAGTRPADIPGALKEKGIVAKRHIVQKVLNTHSKAKTRLNRS